jgi:hypothetical protein
MSAQMTSNGIPMPIVTLNRSVLLTGIILGYILHQPLFTTVLFLVVLPAVLWGQKASLIYFVGSRLFKKLNQNATIISGMVALAAFVALCGFCFGCFLYFQFNMQRYRLFGKKTSTGVNSLQVEH